MEEMKVEDIKQLDGNGKINDKLINCYLSILKERGTKKGWPSTFAYNTNFVNKLMKDGYAGVKRWTKKDDIFSYELLLIPYFDESIEHWVLVIVDFRIKELLVFDSLYREYRYVADLLKKYLKTEAETKKNRKLETVKWEVRTNQGPRQLNNTDCGIFLCMNAEAYTANRKISYTQDDIPRLRKIMAQEIVDKKTYCHKSHPPAERGGLFDPTFMGRIKVHPRLSPLFDPANESIPSTSFDPANDSIPSTSSGHPTAKYNRKRAAEKTSATGRPVEEAKVKTTKRSPGSQKRKEKTEPLPELREALKTMPEFSSDFEEETLSDSGDEELYHYFKNIISPLSLEVQESIIEICTAVDSDTPTQELPRTSPHPVEVMENQEVPPASPHPLEVTNTGNSSVETIGPQQATISKRSTKRRWKRGKGKRKRQKYRDRITGMKYYRVGTGVGGNIS